MALTSREKLLNAVNHQPGLIPVDCGSTAVSGMHCSCVATLREYYNLEKRPVVVHEPYQMLGLIEDDLAAVLGLDTANFMFTGTVFGFANENFKSWLTPWGQEVLVAGNFNVTRKNNDIYMHPEGDVNCAPSACMPDGGYFFDAIIRQEEIVEENLKAEDNLEEYGIVSDEELAKLKAKLMVARNSGKAVIAGTIGTSLGDVFAIPGIALKHPKGIRDITEWYMIIAARPDLVHEIFSKQTELALINLAKLNACCGDLIDVAVTCGMDFGTQSGQFCSVTTFDALWAPYYKIINSWIHQNTQWKTFKHCCGAVVPFIPKFIECGFDILNPVQCSAAGMDPDTIKREFGQDIVFWGGGVDTQKVLPFGTVDEVRRQVLERCRIFGQGGGFVFNSIHNIQARTPRENIIAMFDAVKEFNR
jgi:hypothetical protein